LEDERINNRATDLFVKLLKSVPLTQTTYGGALDELLGGCRERFPSLGHAPEEDLDMIRNFFTEYQVWRRICAGIGKC